MLKTFTWVSVVQRLLGARLLREGPGGASRAGGADVVVAVAAVRQR